VFPFPARLAVSKVAARFAPIHFIKFFDERIAERAFLAATALIISGDWFSLPGESVHLLSRPPALSWLALSGEAIRFAARAESGRGFEVLQAAFKFARHRVPHAHALEGNAHLRENPRQCHLRASFAVQREARFKLRRPADVVLGVVVLALEMQQINLTDGVTVFLSRAVYAINWHGTIHLLWCFVSVRDALFGLGGFESASLSLL
jgi:hypothetical protein